MGFSTEKQVQECMSEQIADDIANRSHRLMGRILLDKGWITPHQIEIVLNELFKDSDTDKEPE